MTTLAPPRASGLERTYAIVEKAIGRPLRDTEKAIDVLKLDAALERAKDELEQAIRDETLRATRAWLAGRAPRPRPVVTPRMRAILADLERLGREEARLELERLGYTGVRTGARSYAAPDPLAGGGVIEALSAIDLGLSGLTVRIEDELVHADLTGATSNAIARALLRVPGGRDIASRVISTALTGGLAATFEENAGMVGGWEYTAVLDGGTCEVCEPLDGTRYATLEGLFRVLPNFGPNPRCRGGGRCRCRAVPLPPGQGPNGPLPPQPEPQQPEPPSLKPPRFATVAEADRWIVQAGLADTSELGTIDAAGAYELADALAQTVGRYGVRLYKIQADPKRKRAIAYFSRYLHERRGSIFFQRTAVKGKTSATKAADQHRIFLANRERAMTRAKTSADDAGRPLALRQRAADDLALLEAATSWATWTTSPRPTFSLIAHEAGHAIDAWHGITAANSPTSTPWRDALARHGVTKADRYTVSEYAASKDEELFAEAFALYIEGRPMPPAVASALEEVLPRVGD